ncbi:AAA family ATPase [Bacillus sp. B1-b2]|nr:AAA family ATPase [Bacillus sp. B1-b2]
MEVTYVQIKKLTIYGYGKLENKTFSIDSSIHVFYGENEAGKSTIMSFIHSILFGFPTKQQSELRYEPKMQHKYGGTLEVLFPKHGLAIIERVKGKATGDVTVTLEDGTRGQEALLESLLLGVDKGIYQSIFSFNLHGLQNIQQMKGEELGRFLFSTGAVGSDVLLKVENELQKELDTRFKPSGKKPLLNEKLEVIKEKYKDLKRIEKENSMYEEVQTRKTQLISINEEFEEELLKENEETRQLEEWIKINPLVLEKYHIEDKLKEYVQVAFPKDGLSRWETIKERLLSIEAKIEYFEKKIAELEKDRKQHSVHEDILNAKKEILTAAEKGPLLEQLQQQYHKLHNKCTLVEEEISILKEKLHLSIDDTKIADSNTSIFMKEQCANAASKQRRLYDQKEELDIRLKEEQALLESLEQRIKEQKAKLLSSEERSAIEARLKKKEQSSWNQDKAKIIERELNQLKDQMIGVKKRSKNQTVYTSIIVTLCLLVTAVALFIQQWIMLILGTSFGMISFLFFLNGRKQAREELEKYQKQLRLIKAERDELLDSNGQNNEWSLLDEKRWNEDSSLREQYGQLQYKLEQQNENYEKVLQGFERWEAEYLNHQQVLRNLANELQLPYENARKQIFDAFLLVEQWKGKVRERDSLGKEIHSISKEKNQIIGSITQLFHQFISQEDDTIANKCYRLRNVIEEEEAKQKMLEDNKRKQGDLKEELETYQIESRHLLHEKERLFSLANVEEEEDFRIKASIDLERKQLEEKATSLDLQLSMSIITKDKYAIYQNIYKPEDQLLKKEEKRNNLKTQIQKNIEELASIQLDIKQMESGGIYTDSLHTFKQLEAEFADSVKEWGKYAVAKQLLSRTVEQYKEKQLPIMLQQAEENLAFLTEGKYIRILPKEEGTGFIVESMDHVFFEAKELSQGTTEQLYLAIRVALAQTFYQKYSFPFIIDDSFVNFDEKRTSKVIQLLKTCKNNQLIFFTCHRHLLSNFLEESVHVLPSQEIKTS